MGTILQVRDIRYSYNGKDVLSIPKLDVVRGTITGLAGPNGSGKSTLLTLLAHLGKPTGGNIEFSGSDNLGAEYDIRRHVSLLPQETYLLRRTVFDNIAYGLKIRGEGKGLPEAVSEALELVGLDNSFARRHWDELSGGEAQRVALAARLVLKPDCLLLDEPTASIDMESARFIRRAVLLARQEWGTTLVIASHHRSWLNDICDRIVYLYNGRVLDCSYENVVTGPWELAEEGLVVSTLSDGQKVYACSPNRADYSVVIPTDSIRIQIIPEHKDGTFRLHGVVASLARESSNGLQIHVACSDQRFIINISEALLSSQQFYPGQEVVLAYNPQDITWLED